MSREWKLREGTSLPQSCASAAVGGRRAFRNWGRTRLALCHYSVGEVGGLRCSNAKKQVLSQTHSWQQQMWCWLMAILGFLFLFTTCIVFISLVSSSVAEMGYSLEIYFKSLTFLQVTTQLVFIYAVNVYWMNRLQICTLWTLKRHCAILTYLVSSQYQENTGPALASILPLLGSICRALL